DFDAKKVYDQDPLSAARAFADAGARFLHVVDLDGAKSGEPVNLEHLRLIAGELGLPVQYGGGLRTMEDVAAAFAAGATRVILGTAIFTNTKLPWQAMEAHGRDNVLVSIDARGGYVATHGWLETTQVPAREAIERFSEGDSGVKRFVFTNIDHDGMLDGVNDEEVEMVARAAGDGSVILSGGIGEVEDLRAVAQLRAERRLDSLDGVIVGKALYEQRFTIAEALQALQAPAG
ncbi:MAG TPA: 1-(5-phosphoribosyl)-5-[(5-phosphoribosylamino)methylideneamino] imidazole-4-carboxamide isomerase, partial [Solirubrobacteraceae bacterium]|nr:1-(5-phosphoribosyl)-5-[(5-phosphoribosylamino)methylideneamino] imidazole-4-carboxamide isomerase [Solirubrobacteraceae bacterium]